MKAILSALALILAGSLLVRPAMADDLIAQRPGIMCGDAKVLAKLTRPDGSSLSTGPTASKSNHDLAFTGECEDIPISARLPMSKRRHNTSIVFFNGRFGGVLDVVPNIDFSSPVPALPGSKSAKEQFWASMGIVPTVNVELAKTCVPNEYVHGIGLVLDCKLPHAMSVITRGQGLPKVVPCAAGDGGLLKDGALFRCSVTSEVPYRDFNNHPQVCPPGKMLANDMSANEPENSAWCR